MRPFIVAAMLAAPLTMPTSALADRHHGHGETGAAEDSVLNGGAGMAGGHDMMAQMMRMMMQMHSGGGMGMPMQGMSMGMMNSFDMDGDGSLSEEDWTRGLNTQLEQFDADADGTIDLDEFRALYAVAFADRIVDRFQQLDADGDGAITADEMAAAAQVMARNSSGMMGGGMSGMSGMKVGEAMIGDSAMSGMEMDGSGSSENE